MVNHHNKDTVHSQPLHHPVDTVVPHQGDMVVLQLKPLHLATKETLGVMDKVRVQTLEMYHLQLNTKLL